MHADFDTAIILKLYVQKATSPEAFRPPNEHPAPYLLTPWQEIEARTALRLKAFRNEITTAEMRASLEAFDEDILSGRIASRLSTTSPPIRFQTGVDANREIRARTVARQVRNKNSSRR